MRKRESDAHPATLVRREERAGRLDCYEFCLLSLGEIKEVPTRREDPWDYVEEREEGGDEHGYQII
jgi:hypothetical protein